MTASGLKELKQVIWMGNEVLNTVECIPKVRACSEVLELMTFER